MTEANGADPGTPMQLPLEDVSPEDRPRALAALLFVAGEPAPLGLLAQHIGCSLSEARAALDSLIPQLNQIGLVLQRHEGDRLQLASAPRFARQVQRFLGLERTVRLSQAALETLAIVAYRQPITRGELEGIRGVDSSGVLQTLIARELIKAVGRLPIVGNPIQYGTTAEFLRFFGLAGLDELPPSPEGLAPAAATDDSDGAHES